MKKIVLIVMLAVVPVFAADPYSEASRKLSADAAKKLKNRTVAVMLFDAVNTDAAIARIASDRITHEIVSLGECAVLERAKIDQVIKEHALSQSGAVKQESCIQIGRLLAVEGIITGAVSKRGNETRLSVRLTRTDNGQIISSADLLLDEQKPVPQSMPFRNETSVRPISAISGDAGRREIKDEAEAKAAVKDVQLLRSGKTAYFIGRVQNTGSIALEKPQIAFSLLDAKGKMLGVMNAFAERHVEPGETVPFWGISTDFPGNYSRYEMVYEARIEKYFTLLTAFSSSEENFSSDGYGNWKLTGMVKNPNSFDVKFLKVIVVLYNDKGSFIGSAHGFSALQKVSAETSAPYTCSIFKNSLLGKPKSYKLLFSAMRD